MIALRWKSNSKWQNVNSNYLWELEPHCRTVKIQRKYYFLSFPYVQFYVSCEINSRKKIAFNSLSVTFRNTPIGPDHPIGYKPPFSNQDDPKLLRVCLGHALSHYRLPYIHDPEKLIESLVPAYFNSEFERLNTQRPLQHIDTQEILGRGVPAWSRLTRQDRQIGTKIDWTHRSRLRLLQAGEWFEEIKI